MRRSVPVVYSSDKGSYGSWLYKANKSSRRATEDLLTSLTKGNDADMVERCAAKMNLLDIDWFCSDAAFILGGVRISTGHAFQLDGWMSMISMVDAVLRSIQRKFPRRMSMEAVRLSYKILLDLRAHEVAYDADNWEVVFHRVHRRSLRKWLTAVRQWKLRGVPGDPCPPYIDFIAVAGHRPATCGPVPEGVEQVMYDVERMKKGELLGFPPNVTKVKRPSRAGAPRERHEPRQRQPPDQRPPAREAPAAAATGCSISVDNQRALAAQRGQGSGMHDVFKPFSCIEIDNLEAACKQFNVDFVCPRHAGNEAVPNVVSACRSKNCKRGTHDGLSAKLKRAVRAALPHYVKREGAQRGGGDQNEEPTPKSTVAPTPLKKKRKKKARVTSAEIEMLDEDDPP